MTERAVLETHLAMARARVNALEAVLEDLDEHAATPAAEEPPPAVSPPAQRKAKAAAAQPSTNGHGPSEKGRVPGKAARQNAPKVAQTINLAGRPLGRSEIEQALGWSASKLAKVLNTLGPAAGEKAWFKQTASRTWDVTSVGLRELVATED